MIEFLSGVVLDIAPGGVILDVNGVGYGLDVPLPFLARLTLGEPCQAWVHTRLREDSLRLFGFATKEDRDLFELLTQVNGIGPKVAMAILSTLSVRSLCELVERNRVDLLTQVPGIGTRTAEKIVMELKVKLPKWAHTASLRLQQTQARVQGGVSPGANAEIDAGDLISALTNLGFREKEVTSLVKNLVESAPDADFPTLLRMSLQRLRPAAVEGAHES